MVRISAHCTGVLDGAVAAIEFHPQALVAKASTKVPSCDDCSVVQFEMCYFVLLPSGKLVPGFSRMVGCETRKNVPHKKPCFWLQWPDMKLKLFSSGPWVPLAVDLYLERKT